MLWAVVWFFFVVMVCIVLIAAIGVEKFRK